MFGFNEVATFKDTLRQLAIKTFLKSKTDNVLCMFRVQLDIQFMQTFFKFTI